MKVNNCFCLNEENDNFLKWYVELLGPVLLGVKPAEILSFPINNQRNMDIFEKVTQLFQQAAQIQFKYLENCGKCRKVLFLNTNALSGTLSEPKNRRFLEQMGYPNEYTLEGYIDFLVSKMVLGSIPDEIGIFLGYPLKDVMGFIGHPALKLTKVDGWRIYGDTRISDIKRQHILQAREFMKEQLQEKTPEAIVLSA